MTRSAVPAGPTRLRRRLLRVGVVALLALGPVLPLAAAPAQAATGDVLTSAGGSLTITGPTLPDSFDDTRPGTQVSVTITPDPRQGVKAGDTLKMTFRGLQPNMKISTLGQCPAALPDGSAPTATSCTGRWPTGIDSPIDTTGNTAALSTVLQSYPLYARQDGTLTVKFIVGAGTVNVGQPVVVPRADGLGTTNDTTARCDTTHACTIGFGIGEGVTTYWQDLDALTITPGTPDVRSAAGCGAFSAATLNGGGAERAQPEAATWNAGLCAGSGKALPVNLVGQGEPDGLRALGDSVDVTFAGSGLLGSAAAPASATPRVLTPVALNAVVLAEIGGIEVDSNTQADGTETPGPGSPPLPSGSPLELPSIQLTQQDVAKILVHDYPTDPGTTSSPAPALAASIRSHPDNTAALAKFGANGSALPFGLAPTTVYPSGDDSTAALLSTQLEHTSAASLVRPDLFGYRQAGTVGDAVGPFTDFRTVADAAGQYTRLTSNAGGIYTSIFGKDVGTSPQFCPELDPTSTSGRASCARFVVTDLVTATSLGLPVASIQNAGGAFVAPSTASLQAAVDQGSTSTSGVFTADLDATGSAYPLAFVEYAATPATPLRTADCTLRTTAQQDLATFATYLTKGGQSTLAPGLAPVTPGLAAVASASLAKIGASTTTGTCAPKAAVPPRATTPASGAGPDGGALPGAAGATPGGSGSSGTGGGTTGAPGALPPVSAAAAAADATTASTSTTAVAAAARTVDIPTFGRAGALGAALPLAGLAVLVALVSGAGIATSQRLRGVTLRQLVTWVRELPGRLTSVRPGRFAGTHGAVSGA